MFANPISGAILSSSGAIPVRRNPNNNGSGSSPPSGSAKPHDPSSSSSSSSSGSSSSASSAEGAARSALFRDTSKALAEGQVVGVFPEGTSYTQASIVQVMPGAAWAAVEYARYVREHDAGRSEVHDVGNGGGGGGKGKEKEVETGLRIVPVAIVYTDKARYLSRISVKYGEPIFIDSYAGELFEGDPDEASKVVVKKVMTQVEKQLIEMTVNAPDWDTICAVSMARSILWGDEDRVPLKDWVEVSQRLVQIFDQPPETASSDRHESILQLKTALTKYYALLHYAGIKHSILLSLLPLSTSSILDIPPPNSLPSSAVLARPTLSLLTSLPLALIRLILFVPPLLLHFPGYFTGPLAAKCLAAPGEEEAAAQFKAVGGGLGVGANIALALGILWKQNKLGRLTALLGLGVGDERLPFLKRVLGLVGSVYFGVLVLVKWHKLLVKANYRQLQQLVTYHKLFSAFAFPRVADSLSTAEVDAYSRPPLPAANVFIKRREAAASSDSNGINTSQARQPPKPIAARKLMRHLLHARAKACVALSAHLKTAEDETLLGYLSSKGAKIPVS
ncbi:hypothetical protein BDZ97DRAFT_1826579 [Flammula alnicola]|nr:hypothetical protein BDZ97DRAFT_1826579 [Flammula alnicola]